MIKYEIEGKTTKAYFVDSSNGQKVSWFLQLVNDLGRTFGIEICDHELFDKFYDFVMRQPWYATVTCKEDDKFCPLVGREMAKKKLLKRYYNCLFRCRNMIITYYKQKVDNAIKKAQLIKIAKKIYDLENELRYEK